ncbi:MAG TPA: pyridoxal phosphate-dependent aminotransferase [Pseudobacteroides sp.]|jgi:aminotransferase|nr:pyridoxal phosphate-dependent aminotransferase [Pseudobacteroides sp.]
MKISNNTQNIRPSAIRKMFNKALQYVRVISFTLGEPDFTASDNVVRAGCEAIKKGYSKYTANAGILELRQAVSNNLFAKNNIFYNPQTEITITVGAMDALYLTLKVLLNPGDEVILSAPCWTNYAEQIKMCDGIPVLVQVTEDNDFRFDIDTLRAAITDKTKAILINSPCNPTGSMLDLRTLEGIADLAKEKDLLVISDEVYQYIVFDGNEHISISKIDGMKERTVIIDSWSKSYAMTGWRVGYAAGPEWLISNITKLQENVVACAATPCQYAALEAITGPQDYVEYMVSRYKERRDIIVEKLNEIPGISCKKPKGTFYAFANIKGTGLTSDEFAMKLLEEKQVVVVPGTAFTEFGEGYIRISFATSMEEIIKGMALIKEFVSGLKK